ncbi:GDSL esterase/lipase [Gossypium australe]|uniref:GDSL esterase/lipase n=1 Tax=Gossypium australe TaxID=47621 RepID=A0A5B6W735_9ROSI|nr:GDSL esterase/lipase [Gossypium australe]
MELYFQTKFSLYHVTSDIGNVLICQLSPSHSGSHLTLLPYRILMGETTLKVKRSMQQWRNQESNQPLYGFR